MLTETSCFCMGADRNTPNRFVLVLCAEYHAPIDLHTHIDRSTICFTLTESMNQIVRCKVHLNCLRSRHPFTHTWCFDDSVHRSIFPQRSPNPTPYY